MVAFERRTAVEREWALQRLADLSDQTADLMCELADGGAGVDVRVQAALASSREALRVAAVRVQCA